MTNWKCPNCGKVQEIEENQRMKKEIKCEFCWKSFPLDAKDYTQDMEYRQKPFTSPFLDTIAVIAILAAFILVILSSFENAARVFVIGCILMALARIVHYLHEIEYYVRKKYSREIK